MLMEKRGQVTVFVIIGIVILTVVILVFALRSKVYVGPANVESLNKEFLDFETEVGNCLDEIGEDLVKQIGLQGGYLNSIDGTYRLYEDRKVNYLCYNLEGPICMNRMLTKQQMQDDLEKGLKNKAKEECLDFSKFKKVGLDYNFGSFDVDVEIGNDNVIMFVKLPIDISKGDVKVSKDEFKTDIDLPLGRLYDASQDILEAETSTGFFDSSLYSVHKTGITNKPYVVKKLQPYPDKLYILKIKDVPSVNNEFLFQFWVQDEEL